MSSAIKIELQESASHAFLDVAVTILEKTGKLNTSFTHTNCSTANDIVKTLNAASKKIELDLSEEGKVIVRTKTGQAQEDLFLIDNIEKAPDIIFEHLKSLTNLRGFTIV